MPCHQRRLQILATAQALKYLSLRVEVHNRFKVHDSAMNFLTGMMK